MSQSSKGSTPGPVSSSEDSLDGATVTPESTFAISSPCLPLPSPSSGSPERTDISLSHEKQSILFTEVPDFIQVETTYPEGGLRAWLVVFGAFSGMVAGFGATNTIGVYQAYIATHQLSGYSESSVGWILSLYVFFSFAGGIQIGPVFDAFGPRFLILGGAILMTLSPLLMSFSTEYWHFIITFSLIGGIGTALLFTPSIGAIGHFFKAKRGNATGVACLGGSCGGIIFPLMLQRLFVELGWSWALRIQGLINLVLGTIAFLLVRSRLAPKPGGTVIPEFRIFRDVPFALVTLGTYLLEWGLFTPITYLTAYALQSGAVDKAFAYQIIAIFNGGSCLGRWAPGYLADKYGRYNLMLIMTFLCLASSLALWLPATIFTAPQLGTANSNSVVRGLLISYSVLMGFASGSNISLTPVCVGMLCDTEEYGRYYATCYTVVSFGTLTGVPIAGAIISACGGAYWGAAIFCGACYICALFAFGAVRVLKVGWSVKSIC